MKDKSKIVNTWEEAFDFIKENKALIDDFVSKYESVETIAGASIDINWENGKKVIRASINGWTDSNEEE